MAEEREQDIEKKKAVVYFFSTEAAVNRVASQGKAAVRKAIGGFNIRIVLRKPSGRKTSQQGQE